MECFRLLPNIEKSEHFPQGFLLLRYIIIVQINNNVEGAIMLFSHSQLKSIQMKNRFFMSAVSEHKADLNGTVSQEQIAFYEKIASGGVGLMITVACNVHPTGKSGANQTSVERDENITGLAKLADALHSHDCRAAVQLCHSGRWNARYQNSIGKKAVAPSYIPDTPYNDSVMKAMTGEYREITNDEILDLITHYAEAAMRVKQSGMDALQIHAAHDSLLAQFLSTATNRRTDQWGGTTENRTRLHRSIISAIREKAGDFPVFLKLGIQDGIAGGLQAEEGIRAAEILTNSGFDAIETSHGLTGRTFNESSLKMGITKPDREAYFRKWSAELKKTSPIPVILSGGIRSLAVAEDIRKSGDADFISMCRPYICEPDLINKWKSGISEKAHCTSCNQCVMNMGKGLMCWMDALH
jgi:2,4-dienoyl-CoA reductase-like NADH-dependent reductase (Old Yellow Enzyme family)